MPKGVLCLLSALQFHEIGTQLPHEVWIALPEGTQAPALSYPLLRITRLRGTAYSDGIQTMTDHGAPIRVYSVAKTVTDCFKFRNKIGLDVALEALKDAWRGRKVTMAELSHFAKINPGRTCHAALPGSHDPMTGNLSASILARLLTLAKQRGDDYNLLLNRFGMERLLARVSMSPARRPLSAEGRSALCTLVRHATPADQGRRLARLRPRR